jgi:hypothetical protein
MEMDDRADAGLTAGSSDSRRSVARIVVVLTLAVAVVAVGLASARRIGIRVYKPTKMACQGTPIKVGVRAQGAARGFRITIVDSAKKKVFSKKSRAQKKWKYWLYSPTTLGTFKTEYRTALGKRRFTTQVSNCQPIASPAPPAPSPSAPAPPSPPPPPPPSCGAEVCLSDNDADGAMFTMSNMAPGSTDMGCIKVSYNGNLTSRVRLYGATGGTGLDPYLNLRVTRGVYAPTDSPFDSCANFSADPTNYIGAGAGVIYSGTLQDYADDYTVGLLDPTPGSPEDWTHPEDHVYKFEITLQDDNSAQGLSATQVFTWEARDVP